MQTVSETSPLLFAYGFLKRKFHGSDITQTPIFKSKFFTEGTLSGHLYQVDSYPGVVYDDLTNHQVKGEVFLLEDVEETLLLLDQYEHALPLITDNPEYARRLRPINVDNGIIHCWVYEYIWPVDPHTEIISGEF
ncbi:MAG: gamma-glutamylcyclotransferase (GGCT)/AIG2-like uncharacterized protein YtfP [Marinoscillum sp.]